MSEKSKDGYGEPGQFEPGSAPSLGEIIKADAVRFAPESGILKDRFWLVIQSNKFQPDSRMVVPFTSWKKSDPRKSRAFTIFVPKQGGLVVDSFADCSKIYTFDFTRIRQRLNPYRFVEDEMIMPEIKRALALMLDIEILQNDGPLQLPRTPFKKR